MKQRLIDENTYSPKKQKALNSHHNGIKKTQEHSDSS